MEHNTAKENADSLGKYFSNKCSLGNNDLQPSDLPDLPAITYPTLSKVRFRASTVQRHLSRLVTSKATGPDNIPATVLKECFTELSSPLAEIFTMCFRAGIQPFFWELARVVPIHKK